MTSELDRFEDRSLARRRSRREMRVDHGLRALTEHRKQMDDARSVLLGDGAREIFMAWPRRAPYPHPASPMWQLPDATQETYARNPLKAVVWQLRFHPILKIPERIPEFQERVRSHFPRYQVIEGQKVDVRMQPMTPAFQMRRETSHLFGSGDNQTTVSLGREAISITESNHHSRERLIETVELALKALAGAGIDVLPTRLGLRYVNLIDREAIGKDLGRAVEWRDLVNDRFLQLPFVDLDATTTFYSEVTSEKDPGVMTLRYGLLSDDGSQPTFRLDADRYEQGTASVTSVVSRIREFAADIFAVFQQAAGRTLLEWMEARDAA